MSLILASCLILMGSAPDQCEGNTCTPVYYCPSPPPAWQIVLALSTPGRSFTEYDCDTCRMCSGTVVFAYSGGCAGGVNWGEGYMSWDAGGGTKSGAFRVDNSCDGPGSTDVFEEECGVGLFYGKLLCPCLH